MRQTAGFTLIEILLVVAMVAILAGMTVPAVAGAMDRYYINAAGQQVASTIRTARFQAVARNSNVRVTFDEDASTYQAEVWDANAMPAAYVALGTVQRLPNSITFAGTPADVVIEPTGRAGGCTCTVSVTNGNAEEDRTITVSTSGRVQLQ